MVRGHNYICVMISSQNPHVVLHRPTFTVGQGRQCDLWVRDPTISKSLCKLKRMESEVSCLLLAGVNFSWEVKSHMVLTNTLESMFICLLVPCLIQEGESLTLLEITGKKGAVQVNGKNYYKDTTIPINAGDEVVFSSSDKRSYVSFLFQSSFTMFIILFSMYGHTSICFLYMPLTYY